MITIPIFAEVDGIQIFRDDTDPSKFYYLPRTPRIVTNNDGKPMFTFMRYQFPIERPREEPGGGYLVFTTAMNEDSDTLERRVKPFLEKQLRANLPVGATLPPLTLSPVQFTGGEVRLIMMQNNEFIRAIHLGRPSLFGDNTASVAVELNSDAATLFYEALKRGGSIAAIEYSLTFPVRLPAVTILGKVDSQEVKKVVMEYTDQRIRDENFWGTTTTRDERQRTSISETMHSQGLVSLEIIKGDVDLSDEDMESLRAFAFRSMDEFIKDNFLQGGSVENEEDRRSQWMEFLSQDVHRSYDLNVSYRDVISREYHPSAQISPSFLGVPVDQVLMDIDLENAPWYFNNLEVQIDTNFDFEKYGEFVHSVVGHLTYDQLRPDGTRLTKRESVMFTAHDRSPKKFQTRLAEVGKDTYHVDVEVNYKAGPVLQTTVARFDTMTRNLTLNVPNPGIVEVNFAAAPGAFDSHLIAVEVEVDYSDPRNKVARTVETVILDKDRPEADYRRVIYAPWERPFRYRYTYVLQGERGFVQRSTTEWMEASHQTRNIKVPTPFDEEFGLTIIPSVDWSSVLSLVVDLEYVDSASDYRMSQTYNFTELVNDVKRWQFPLRNPDHRAYRYRQTLMLKNSAVQEYPWQERESDTQTLVVGNAPHGVVNVEIDPSDIDLGRTVRRVIVRLRYSDPALPQPAAATLVFRDWTPQNWTIVRGPSHDQFVYEVEYFMDDGRRLMRTEQLATIHGNDEFLFLPGPPETEPLEDPSVVEPDQPGA